MCLDFLDMNRAKRDMSQLIFRPPLSQNVKDLLLKLEDTLVDEEFDLITLLPYLRKRLILRVLERNKWSKLKAAEQMHTTKAYVISSLKLIKPKNAGYRLRLENAIES